MATTAAVRTVTLRTGAVMPLVSLGTWKAEPGVVKEAVLTALRLGYRGLDCACDYGNEAEVGEAIREAITEGIVTREELFITSKLWNTYHKREHVAGACRKSLEDLGLEYIDLYLIHFPISLKYVPIETRYPPEWIYEPDSEDPRMIVDPVPVSETWAGMEALVEDGFVRSIGVANFNMQLLGDLLSYANLPPAVNQVELHPYLTQQALVQFCADNDVHVTGFSPLGSTSYIALGMDKGHGAGLLEDNVITSIAERLGKSPAQIALRWNVQRGVSIVPKSTNEDRLRQNLNLFDFELTDEDMEAVAGLNRNARYNDPGVFCKFMGLPNGCPIYA